MSHDNRLTTDDLDRLDALLEQATPGPWKAVSRHCGVDDSRTDYDDWFLGWEIEGLPEPTRGQFVRGGDAHLVVAAVNALPALLGHSALNTTLGYAHLRDTTVVVELQGRSSPIDARLGGTTQQRVSGQQTLSGDVFARHEQAIKRLRRANHA